ncbi:MAG TPA: DNA methyltransferase [Novosphingobium sp.]|nr:DNA methyltransferase [Novosphingobium sp.]
MEHRANLDAEALGLPRGFPRVGPECVLGIELNPYAAELARVSVWIGEIQWMRRNGFDAAKNPILRPLETIECRDAVLNADGTRAEWPRADVAVGNPPFLGNYLMIAELGEHYTVALRRAWLELPGSVDLVCYWFAKAWAMMVAGRLQRAGLVATNSIRGGANREVLKPIVEHGSIFDAWSDEEWSVEGAAVRVSIICFATERQASVVLGGRAVETILADLTSNSLGFDLTEARKLPSNSRVAFEGPKKYGNFEMSGSTARAILAQGGNPHGEPNARVMRPWLNGRSFSQENEDMWIADFTEFPAAADACLFEAPFALAEANVRAKRQEDKNPILRDRWWLFERTRPALRGALKGKSRYIATVRHSKHRLFRYLPIVVLPDTALIAIARDDDTSFGILHSRFHELWSLRMGTSLEDRPRYTPSTTFETFPFPEGLTPNIPASDYAADPRAQAVAAAAARLNELRENWLNPADLVVREPEVVAGYPDRILPRDAAAAAELKKRTLTILYNARPQWLANAHAALDEAVAEAYGWGDDFRAGALTDDEVLARLFALNQARSSS